MTIDDPMSAGWLFDQLSERVRSGLLPGRSQGYGKGEVVFHEHDLGDTIHMIKDGLFAVRAATTGGRSLIITVLGARDIFGEFAVFSAGGRRTSTVTALAPGTTVALLHDDLGRVFKEQPLLIEGMMASVIEKAESTNRRLVELLAIPADLRVLRALLLVDGLARTGGPVPLTQVDLANLAATTRPTANRVLREEADRGTLSLARGSVTVVDAVRLANRAKLDRP